MNALEKSALSPSKLNPWEPGFDGLVDCAGLQQRAVERLNAPTEKSSDVLVATLFSIQRVKGKSKAAVAAKAVRAEVAKKMLAAGWAGVQSRQRQSLWDATLATRDGSLIEAALSAGLRPWSTDEQWRHTPIGLAMYKKRFDQALALAQAMTPSEVEQAGKQRMAMLFDLLDLQALSAPGTQELWEAWKSKGLSIDARDYGQPDGETALMCASRRASQACLAAIPLLLLWGADPKLVDQEGQSALHRLCDLFYPSMGEAPERAQALLALLGAGVDPLALDRRGQKASDLARASKWDEGVALLAPFEQRSKLDEDLVARQAKMGAQAMELRRRGCALLDPQGSPVEWSQALACAASPAPTAAKPRSL